MLSISSNFVILKKRNFNAETQAILGVHAIEEYQEIKQENRLGFILKIDSFLLVQYA